MTVHYEDLSIGDTFELGSQSLTKDEIISFAEQFDPQPFHVDEEKAADSMFGELVASGLHTLCLSVRIFVTEFVNTDNGLANMGGLGLEEVRWHEAVTPGESLSLMVEVVEKEPSNSRSDRGYITFERRMHNEDDILVLSYRTVNIVGRQNPAASAE